MNPETTDGPPERLELDDLRRAHLKLRAMVHLSALCGIILSATIFVFLFKQLAVTRRQNDELKAYVQDYNASFVPLAEAVRTNMLNFCRSHPTLAPILQKYYTTNTIAAP